LEEDRAGRGATETASAPLNHLNSLKLHGTKIIHLIFYGCACQYMNSHVTHILMENVEGILIVFPVRDHSYFSADYLGEDTT
jgi:hypothetical protein